ncbi:MMPL family transporter [Anaerocolumna jejuensis]|uniref:MMPL family transporter n=1 Tax=Anaerocolumna jejuensis TaxID=259063 RepID=UPI003F7B8858
MKTIIKGRWAICIIWILAAVVLTIVQPDVNAILRDRGQSALGEDSSSVVASDIVKKMETTKGASDLIVFFNKDKLTDKQKTEIKEALQEMRDNNNELGITEMIDPFSMPEAAASLYSEDGTTLMVSLKVDKQNKSVNDLVDLYKAKLNNVSAEHYLSGEDFINNDYQSKSEAGVEKSAVLTVLFILVVLIIVFRSIITPIVSLLGVAFAFITANGIAAQLIDKADFPVTSLTTMLLILILFGIGTDYNILLFSRFREELAHGKSVDDSILHTYKTAGKTITYSIITVLIAFAALMFAKCPIYKSGAVVVIGVVMLLLEILTLTPFIMKVLGKKLFWPSKNVKGHKESKMWGGMAAFSSKHSIISFFAVLIIILPMILFYKESLSFNLVGELGDSSPSSKGFNLVSEHYGAGQMMTTTVVIENKKALDKNESLVVIDNLTDNLKKISGVEKVSSVTQPEGVPIKDFYLGSQLDLLGDGLSQSKEGLKQIYQGLEAAQKQMGTNQFDETIGALEKIADGLGQTDSYMVSLGDLHAFYMPEQAIESENYQQVMKMFLSENKKITKLTVVLKDDPYSEAAQDTVKKINQVLKSTIEGSSLSGAKYGVSGTSATTADTNDVLSKDLQRTAVIVIIGVFVVLFLLIRSVWTPLAIVGSLIGAYFTAATAMNAIFIDIRGLEGISSFIPFFAFIIIIALGVDYSIFLIMRFKEYPDMPVGQAMVMACKHIGGVVMSAIIILGGTFATLIPSGMVLLEELAVAVIVGLVMLCFILLPIFLPASMALPDTLKKFTPSGDKKKR